MKYQKGRAPCRAYTLQTACARQELHRIDLRAACQRLWSDDDMTRGSSSLRSQMQRAKRRAIRKVRRICRIEYTSICLYR